MNDKKGTFRFAYFSDIYEETCNFYSNILELNLEFSWDRDENDKGSVFGIGFGLIEILHRPEQHAMLSTGLDYRTPQGAFMVIEIWNIDDLFGRLKQKNVPFKQELTIQSWGHKSFSIIDPNGIILFFYEG